MPSTEEVRVAWDAVANSTRDLNHMVKRHVSREQYDLMISDVKSKLGLVADNSLLDVGCGNAKVLRSLRPAVRTVAGTDLSEALLAVARQILPSCRLTKAAADCLPFADSSFDRVLCNSVFHYFPNLAYAQETIRELCRVCCDQGIVLVGDIPSKRLRKRVVTLRWQVVYRLKVLLRRHPGPSIHNPLRWQFFDLAQLARFADSLGHAAEVLKQPRALNAADHRLDLRIRIRK